MLSGSRAQTSNRLVIQEAIKQSVCKAEVSYNVSTGREEISEMNDPKLCLQQLECPGWPVAMADWRMAGCTTTTPAFYSYHRPLGEQPVLGLG